MMVRKEIQRYRSKRKGGIKGNPKKPSSRMKWGQIEDAVCARLGKKKEIVQRE